MATFVAATLTASAQLAFESENSISVIPNVVTYDNAAKIVTIDDDNNVEIYEASLNRIKTFKANTPTTTSGNKTEVCSNAENIKLTGCEMSDAWWVYDNSNAEIIATDML